MKLTTPGRLAAAPRGGTEPDRETRIGFGALTPPRPWSPAATGPRGPSFHASRVAQSAVEQLS